MTMLTYILGLVLTLLILYPFVMFVSASIFALYFKYKEEHIAKMAKALGEAAMETVKKMNIPNVKKTTEE